MIVSLIIAPFVSSVDPYICWELHFRAWNESEPVLSKIFCEAFALLGCHKA